MANPTLPSKSSRMDYDDVHWEGEGFIVNDKVVVSSQQALVADAALTATSGVVRATTTVDSSAGGTAQTANCTLVPAQSIILNVEAEVVTPMDGDATTTLEVGVSGNIDAYIDTVDFDPSAVAGTVAGSASGTTNDVKTVQYVGAATQVIATWTNTASASAGDTTVTVHYIPLSGVDMDTVETKINAILDILESHGLMADA